MQPLGVAPTRYCILRLLDLDLDFECINNALHIMIPMSKRNRQASKYVLKFVPPNKKLLEDIVQAGKSQDLPFFGLPPSNSLTVPDRRQYSSLVANSKNSKILSFDDTDHVFK